MRSGKSKQTVISILLAFSFVVVLSVGGIASYAMIPTPDRINHPPPPPPENYVVSCSPNPVTVGQNTTCSAIDDDGNGILVTWSANITGTWYNKTSSSNSGTTCYFTQKGKPFSCSVVFQPSEPGNAKITATNWVIDKQCHRSIDGSDKNDTTILVSQPGHITPEFPLGSILGVLAPLAAMIGYVAVSKRGFRPRSL